MIKKSLPILFIALTGLFQKTWSQNVLISKYAEEIKADSLSVYLHKLTSDEFEGRETGQKGQQLAATYIAERFKASGIPPYSEQNQYFQPIPLILKGKGEADFKINGKSFQFLKDFYFFSNFEDTTLKFDHFEFIGYGIKDSSYDELSEANIKGKAVVMMDGEPKNTNGTYVISKTTKHSVWTSLASKEKLYKLREFEPSCIIVVTDSITNRMSLLSHNIETPRMKIEGTPGRKGIPTFFVSREMADVLFRNSPKSLDALKQDIMMYGPRHDNLKANVSIVINRPAKRLFSENVLGYLEGSDLKDQLIVISAHYDHLGKDGKTIYYGADDDGSGTSAVVELARVFAKAKQEGHGPRRSILFLTVAGEEKGLLGSDYYSSHPVYPLSSTVADLNIDMIGRVDEKHASNPDYIYVIGSDKLSTQLHKINEEANSKYTHLLLDYTFNDPGDVNRFYYRSDHYNFAKHSIPIIFYFNGVHADYHKPSDTVDKINFQKMEKISRLVFCTAWDLANRDERITVDVKNDFKNDR